MPSRKISPGYLCNYTANYLRENFDVKFMLVNGKLVKYCTIFTSGLAPFSNNFRRN
eukprot:Pgem_evm1s8729